MKEDQAKKIKKRLEKLKEEILIVIKTEEDPDKTREAIDEIDQATDVIEQEMGSIMSSNFHVNLKMVNEALERLQKGTYGICLNCEKEIPLKRLEVLPFASYCIGCQQEMEEDN
jgi:DnaK suppressor protein